MSHLRLVGFITLIFFANPAGAQHPIIVQKLTEWNEAAPSPDNALLEQEVLTTAAEIYGPDGGCQDTQVALRDVRPATADRYVFTGVLNGTLRNAWFVTASLPGCDNAPVRFMVIRDADEDLRTIRVNRGDSIAWDSLFVDTLPLARLGALATLRSAGVGCATEASHTLGVTRVANEGSDLGPDVFGGRYAGSWSEIWPITICERTVEVFIEFTADGDGGAYTRVSGDQSKLVSENPA
ncbi:hypothetical protein [Aurantiacibacter zhengii]|uniref:Uncharacterized protein n=1 Tax=Aurantiacibacter zhengii TaxID=2307003 RepID=A0A418NX17_9SPHN|nr:hypothetical protein [Aurantiacibacter zhengii]RIV89128.1 hypothetical protein D2V07_02465 [Aurantiacibacter zhengii]